MNKEDIKTKEVLSSGAFGTAYLIKDSSNNKFILKELLYNQEERIFNEINKDIQIIKDNNEILTKHCGLFKKKNNDQLKIENDNLYYRINSLTSKPTKTINNIISGNIEINILKYIQDRGGCDRRDIACYVDDFINYDYKTISIVTLPFMSNNRPAPTLENMFDKSSKKRILLKNSFKIALNILYAFEFLHSIGITHNDIKPANILIDENTFDIHVIDFGGACKDKYCMGLGTMGYVHKDSDKLNTSYGKRFNKNLDIYSLGKVLNLLFNMYSDKSSCKNFSPELDNTIQSMLNIDINNTDIDIFNIIQKFKKLSAFICD